ncbi:TetR family transcriptional regulator [Williamsia maris]|uniref:Transcriptional regulator, TetR family n=1 Tax=Williamsia maris TaxID=72806 RepID=A0ABT1HBF3_9NOCA|nr:TetR family transcriptional regulator [Williamsia maris]MCP2175581.1 transcriptional regulator, TetR family [Williamsia maris]
MPRSGQEARHRLQQAALELFTENGFDRTTTAEIAARAGVNDRTFFRHFPDKREVLFGGEAELRDLLVTSMDSAPATDSVLDTLLAACLTTVDFHDAGRDFARPRHALVAATPELHERELSKLAALATAMAESLRQRGIPEARSRLAAQIGMAAFVSAVDSWYDDPSPGLAALLRQAFDDVQEITSSR